MALNKKSMRYEDKLAHHPLHRRQELKEKFEAIDSHMTLIHALLEEVGFRPFGKLELVLPDTHKTTFEWNNHA